MPPRYWVQDWHEEYGGLYSELKAREENIDEINEKLLEFY